MSSACLTPDCGRIAMQRGLCKHCYNRLHELVRRGKTTWAELEAAGRCRSSNAAASKRHLTRRFFTRRK